MFFFDNGEKIKEFKPLSVEHAYLAILNNDLKSAEAVFEAIDSPRARWGRALIDILNGYVEHYPTYFEIRNFLEIDLDFLIKNKKLDYIEQVLGSLEFLSTINQEVYKYAARVLYENNYIKTSKEYMDKSRDLFYKDPELHFMLAKYHIREYQYKDAAFHLNECLKIVPEYMPAQNMKKEIKAYLD